MRATHLLDPLKKMHPQPSAGDEKDAKCWSIREGCNVTWKLWVGGSLLHSRDLSLLLLLQLLVSLPHVATDAGANAVPRVRRISHHPLRIPVALARQRPALAALVAVGAVYWRRLWDGVVGVCEDATWLVADYVAPNVQPLWH